MEQMSGIVAFVRAAELGGFTRAAQVIGITPSGVGKSISRLEASLGVRLLQRTTRRISLTDDGAVFFAQCRQLIDELDSALNQLSHRSVAPRGRLRVSMPMTIGKRLILPQLAHFTERYPEVRLELGFSDRFINLLEENVDVAVRIGTLNDSTLVARPIATQQLVTIAGARLPDACRIRSVEDLDRYPALVFRQLSSRRERPWRFQVAGRVLEHHPRASMLIDDGEALVAAARAGLGVTQVPDNMVAEGLAAGELVELLPETRTRPDPINAIYVSQKNVPARVRAFVEFLSKIDMAHASRAASASAGALPQRVASAPDRPARKAAAARTRRG